MTTDHGDEFEGGERLVLVTDAREAGTAAFHAALKHRSIVVSELLLAGGVLTLGVFGSGGPAILGFAVVGLLEVLRRRARSELERAEAVAEDLAAVVDAMDHPHRHPLS